MSSILSHLFNSYVDYLWNYDSSSWVATVAYAFRIWAILAILPTLVLALLDVTSYVIARTLGDPTAATSHKSSFATQPPPNSNCKIANAADSIDPPTGLGDSDHPNPVAILRPEDDESPSGITSTKPVITTPASTAAAAAASSTTDATSSRAFFVDGEGSEDDGAARLAGVGVFSPVASMPGSPTVSRGNFFEKDGEDDAGGGGGSGSSAASGTDESGLPFVASRGGILLRSSVGGAGDGFTIHHHQQQQHHQHHQGGREAETEQEHGHEHEHEHEHSRSASDGGGGGGGSTSGESSFAILDREESIEDAGVHIRRRVPGVPADE